MLGSITVVMGLVIWLICFGVYDIGGWCVLRCFNWFGLGVAARLGAGGWFWGFLVLRLQGDVARFPFLCGFGIVGVNMVWWFLELYVAFDLGFGWIFLVLGLWWSVL